MNTTVVHSDKDPHRQFGMTSGSIGGVMVSTLASSTRDVSLNPARNFPHFNQPHDTGVLTRILYKLCTAVHVHM